MGLSVIAGLAFSVGGLAFAGDVSRIAAFGGGPNTFARVTGMAMIGVIYFVITGTRKPWFTLILAPLALATVLSGSRGAILGTLVGLSVLAFAFDRRGWRRMAIGLGLAMPAIALVYVQYGQLVVQTVQFRIVKLSFEDHYTSGRDDLFAEAWAMFQDRPFAGSGLGSFELQYGIYPHNLFLQTAAEAGFVGLLILFSALFVCFRHLFGRNFRNPDILAPFASFSLILTASMFSGGYYDTRYMWAYLMIAVSQASRLKSASDRCEQLI